ncbi:MAG: hypothetical protein Q8876_05665 [Bacillota bacterium]|nr:hypothetical protein [Bacillota bacterium]
MIEILDFKEINKGAIFGTVNVRITKWGLTINKCLIFQKEGRKWLSLPQETFEKDGKKNYFPLVKFDDRETSERFGRQVLEAVEKLINEKPQVGTILGTKFESNQDELPF